MKYRIYNQHIIDKIIAVEERLFNDYTISEEEKLLNNSTTSNYNRAYEEYICSKHYKEFKLEIHQKMIAEQLNDILFSECDIDGYIICDIYMHEEKIAKMFIIRDLSTMQDIKDEILLAVFENVPVLVSKNDEGIIESNFLFRYEEENLIIQGFSFKKDSMMPPILYSFDTMKYILNSLRDDNILRLNTEILFRIDFFKGIQSMLILKDEMTALYFDKDIDRYKYELGKILEISDKEKFMLDENSYIEPDENNKN